ncbi:thermonuclease family protein [Candidatus Thiothrix anitrata]|uniref:Thermonuclease family protein n=1 Tax=Candidatus Thiothrix anitrata TaxID=2823902 RepID=A0ABX7X009_9GAMM|nr:thermonuclease family protein [Candidatus Thiothrix anitrata]QTR49249.1 thermonuclease family protein [Candidatus Thiothrix anitrata]
MTFIKIPALLCVALLVLSAYQKDLTAQQRKLQEKLPSDAELTAAGTLIAQGQVVHIADGDSLTVLASNKESFKIRLQGIDAPERGQAFGKHCKEQLNQLANGKAVQVEAYKQDKYGRIIAKISVGNSDLALTLLRQGCAWHYTAYAKEQSPRDNKTYAKAEKQARTAQKGLWQDENPIAPWDYRHRK